MRNSLSESLFVKGRWASRLRRGVFLMALGVCLPASFRLHAGMVAAVGPDSIRVYAVRPATFDYVFTSVVTGTGGRPLLAFNRRDGQTSFVRVGENLGPYRVKTFEPRTDRVFTPSVNAHLNRDAGLVTLEDPDGETIVLEQNRETEEPGWLACLVSKTTGRWAFVRDGEKVDLDGRELAVAVIGPETVMAAAGGEVVTLPFLSEEEKQELAARRRQTQLELAERKRREEDIRRREEMDAALQRVELPRQPRPAVEARRPQFTVEVRHPPRFFYGSEYLFPTDFQVIPSYRRLPSGRVIPSAVVVPTRFERRSCGVAITYR